MNRRLAAAFALCVSSGLTGCWSGRPPVDCLDEARLDAEKPQVLIVDAETGEPIRDAAVWSCPDAPVFHHFGAVLLDARWDASSSHRGCDALVSHPGHETREVRRGDFTRTPGVEEICATREPVDVIRLRRLPGAAEVPTLAPPAREAFVSPGLPRSLAYDPGLVVLEEAARWDRLAPASGVFAALDDPRLVALARRPGPSRAVGWLLDGRFCTHRLEVVPDMRASPGAYSLAILSAGLEEVGWHHAPDVDQFTVEAGVGPGAHRGMVEVARRAAARLPVGWMVGFECREPPPSHEPEDFALRPADAGG